tara:strand:+ start:154 stop:573 length:420 start_codon:yes stop_codon:yes gene_type:complete
VIVKAPNKILSTQTELLTVSNYRAILSKFIMRELPHRPEALGIAGNQVKLPYSIFSMKKSGKWTYCINPKILVYAGEKIMYSEGCLSKPKKHFDTERYTQIDVAYLDKDFRRITETLHNLDAIIFQHEVGHLKGKLIGE